MSDLAEKKISSPGKRSLGKIFYETFLGGFPKAFVCAGVGAGIGYGRGNLMEQHKAQIDKYSTDLGKMQIGLSILKPSSQKKKTYADIQTQQENWRQARIQQFEDHLASFSFDSDELREKYMKSGIKFINNCKSKGTNKSETINNVSYDPTDTRAEIVDTLYNDNSQLLNQTRKDAPGKLAQSVSGGVIGLGIYTLAAVINTFCEYNRYQPMFDLGSFMGFNGSQVSYQCNLVG